MLIALFADIHANRQAFGACLAQARDAGAERIVLLGDYVGYGADEAAATAKAEKEAKSFVRLFTRVSRAIEENPARVSEAVRQRSDVPAADFEEFRRLLDLR